MTSGSRPIPEEWLVDLVPQLLVPEAADVDPRNLRGAEHLDEEQSQDGVDFGDDRDDGDEDDYSDDDDCNTDDSCDHSDDYDSDGNGDDNIDTEHLAQAPHKGPIHPHQLLMCLEECKNLT